MQSLIKIIHNELTIKITKITLIVIAMPFIMYVINLCLLTIYNLGHFSGTFLRNLYNFVC